MIALDVNEGVVPAHEDVNPLLPEPLRPAVGLPPKEREEAIMRYHFERLVGSAGEVHLVWQASTSTSRSGIEGKKTRSRFVETLLWAREAEAGRLLDNVIDREVLTIPPQALVKDEGLPRSDVDSARVAEFVRTRAGSHGISATLLNSYLRCPLRFMYQYLLELEIPEAPLEEIDSAELGTLVHKALEAYFRPYESREYVRARHSDPGRLVSLFTELYGESPMYRSLGPEKRFFLESTVTHRLRSYLDAMPDATFIESLERRYAAGLVTSLGQLPLGGKVDRIDRRNGNRIILDYKTGSASKFGADHFSRALADMSVPATFDYEGLKRVREGLTDVQLPLYVLLVSSAAEGGSGDKTMRTPAQATGTLAAYVALGTPRSDKSDERFKERYFVRPDKAAALGEAYQAWFAGTFPALLAYVIDHMVKSPCFYRATDESDCTYCDYSTICGLAFA